MLTKGRILVIIFLALLAAGAIYGTRLLSTVDKPPEQNSMNDIPKSPETDPPKIISTKPDPLNEAIISATEVIEVTFNRPLENVGEFKVRIEPEKKIKVELSGDRKTAKIIPLEPYDLGAGYTIFIGPETKFDGVGRWGEEKIYHFQTIKYRGI